MTTIFRSLAIFLATAMLLLGACTTTENYEKVLNSWVGANADDLAFQWGPPTSIYPKSDGGKIIEYVRTSSIKTGGYTYTTPQTQTTYNNITGAAETSTTYVQKTTPISTLDFWCKTRFDVDRNGRITQWKWEGNDCAASPPE